MILGVGVPTAIISSVLFSAKEVTVDGFADVIMLNFGASDGQFEFSIISHIVSVLVAIFLIRHWSAQWNKKFS